MSYKLQFTRRNRTLTSNFHHLVTTSSHRLIIFLFSAFLLQTGCNFQKDKEEKWKIANEAVPKPAFNSELDSLKWVLENYQLTTVEKLWLYIDLIYESDDFDEERKYALEGLSLAKAEKNEIMTAKLYRNFGGIYVRYGIRDSAWFYLNMALSEARRLKDKGLESVTFLIWEIFLMGERRFAITLML